MSTLYRPVLIESVEQAEALPIGTVATRGAIAAVRVPEQTHDEPWRSGVLGWEHVSAIGWTALVLISVEDLIRDTVTEALAEQARQKEEADRKRREFDDEVRRRAEEQYLTRPYPATQFIGYGEA